MERSSNLDLPFIMPSQAQKHVTHNGALSILDALVHCAVESRALGEPPVAAEEGQRYLAAAAASGAWAGKAGQIAAWQDGGWCFYPPQAGMLIFVKEESLLLLHDGAAFGPPLARTEWLGVNTDADEQNRLAVAGPSTLLTHDGTDHRVAVNKAAMVDTASLIFQENYSGRAEIGLAGNDRLSVKVSPDGESWTEALTINPTTGNIGLQGEPDGVTRLRVSGGIARFGTHLVSAEETTGGPAMEIGFFGSGDRPAYFDFHADDEWTDYASRFIRWGGKNGAFTVYNRGLGGIDFYNTEAGQIRFSTSSQLRMTVDVQGNVGIGTAAPTTALHVAGPVRTGSFAKANLPAAGTVGAGALAWATDVAGGGALVFCNGTAWRKVTDGGAV
ncbi:hypothetical protein ASD64_09535 [Mesorhizobium sp. Root157]|uniref:DUF2793 domain-containing protein n=1 Tax=Mesorhizobium sp. Root157 TaxID=1736477 RepID=UPI0006F675EB|nr:DUF2793 domain-containing protein [Mesorhizobium sp. Root157]KQZ81971.1 hypothetical protein ASD64_09535 [Mesorhizobium sp. Root157]